MSQPSIFNSTTADDTAVMQRFSYMHVNFGECVKLDAQNAAASLLARVLHIVGRVANDVNNRQNTKNV